jgi:uncharacterized protein YegJ (DUF2314 family)
MTAPIYIDSWASSTKPIDIPKGKKLNRVSLRTASAENIVVLPVSYNEELCTGVVENTPPVCKPYKKGDRVMFHRENIIFSQMNLEEKCGR